MEEKNKKPTAVIFLGEPQTMYDMQGIEIADISKEEWKIVENMWQVRRLLGVEKAFFVLASPIGTDPASQPTDFNFRNLKSAAISQSFIEGHSTVTDEPMDAASTMGPCFYKDGYFTLNKEMGFGKWKLDKIEDSRTPLEKVMTYLGDLFSQYDVQLIIEINDKGLSEKTVDIEEIKKIYGIPVISFEPCLPHCQREPSVDFYKNGDGVIRSQLTCLKGTNDCFARYITHLEKENEKRHINCPK